ncbi:MAG: hypothetical protein ACKOA0_00880, partial [Burkholderiaceae bacterium]
MIAVEVNYLLAFPDVANLPDGDFVSARFAGGGVMGTRGGEDRRTTSYTKPVQFNDHIGSRIETADMFIDQQARMVGWAYIEGYPLLLIAASSLERAFSGYESTRFSYETVAAGVSGLLLLISVFGAITQIRSSAQRHRQAEVQATFRLAVDAAREAFYMMSPAVSDHPTWIIEDCNERAAEMQYRTRSEMIGRPIEQL